MKIRVFKFGGASVNSAKGVRNVASILQKQGGSSVVVVVSAMGKTTNALEKILDQFLSGDAVSMVESFYALKDYHEAIVHKLFRKRSHPVYPAVETLFVQLQAYLQKGYPLHELEGDYNFHYDHLVSYGELLSSTILCHFLLEKEIPVKFLDARLLIRTDATYRDARVDWDKTRQSISELIPEDGIYLTQGFIGGGPDGQTTTLGREGSDYTAAILAHCLKTSEMTIWKDVPGIMNADPKWFKSPKKIDLLSYQEAIELAYFGASVVHPKTIKPLENAEITLHVKSFLKPGLSGTRVMRLDEWTISKPIYIRKQNQVLISVSPRDFSFIVEENLGQIFSILARHRVSVNVMQNSAISFSVCVDALARDLKALVAELRKDYRVRYNAGMELYTIRHYNEKAIRRVVRKRKILLEQKTRNTVHLVVTE